jgi:hypothetical protein
MWPLEGSSHRRRGRWTMRPTRFVRLIALTLVLCVLGYPAGAVAAPANVAAAYRYDTPTAATILARTLHAATHVARPGSVGVSRSLTSSISLRRAAKGGRVLPLMAGGAPKPEEILRPGGEFDR